MKNNRNRKIYTRPEIGLVKIDKSISMVMQSLPPGDPGTKIKSPVK